MVNYIIATVREFMFCTWPQIRMERLFLQLIKKKLTCLDKFPPLNYHKALNPLFFVLSLKFQKNLPHYLVPFKILLPIPLRGGGGGGGGGGGRGNFGVFLV